MENTKIKVNKVYEEIGISNNKYLNSGSKSVDDVIKIMLSSNNNSPKISDVNSMKQSVNYNFDMEELLKWKSNNNNIYNIQSNWVIRSHRKFIGKLIIFGKKVARKLLRWYIEPIVEQQNKFNGSVTASVNALYNNEVVTMEFIANSISSENNRENSVRGLSDKLSSTELLLLQKFSELELAVKDTEQIYLRKIVDLEQENKDLQEKIIELEQTTKESILSYSQKNLDLEQEIKNVELVFLQKASEVELSTEKSVLTYAQKVLKLEDENLGFKSYILDEFSKKNQQNEVVIQNLKNKTETELDYLEFKLSQLNNKQKKLSSSTDYNNSKTLLDSYNNESENSNTYDLINYFKFENNFRGSRSTIKNGQTDYIKYFNGRNRIIDLGCGRGEFLELLKENNVGAIGVDLYEEFVEYCKYKGLNAIYGDGVEYVKDLEDESIEGLFASQVAEHLNTEQLLMLCKEAYKKLKSNCYFIMETPNPTCLSTYTNAFYIDPSHVKPVHPKTLKFFMSEAGFKDIQIIYTEQSKVDYKLPLLDGENINNLAEFNDGINLLTEIIFGSQDYAIIAKK